MKLKIKSCSCRHCKRGRHNYRRIVERKARRYWREATRKLARDPLADVALTNYGGGYTD